MLGKTLIILILLSSILTAQSNFQLLNQTKSNAKIFNENYSMCNNYSLRDNTFMRKHTFLNLAGQVVAGVSLAGVISFLPLVATMLADFYGGSMFVRHTGGALFVAAYILGTAVGVRMIARIENENLSFWGTLGYSARGALGSLLIIAAFSPIEKQKPGLTLLAALCPLISSMIYTSSIAEWPTTTRKPVALNKYLSHKDVYERGKLFNIELFRVGL